MQINLPSTTFISVAIATYNGEKYLIKQLDSILTQSLPCHEIIIVDDASSDATWSILQRYQQQDSRIQLYKNEYNLGATKTFERAVNLCTGDFIALSDQDDIWMQDKLAILIKNIGHAKLIHSDALLIDGLGNPIKGSLLQFIEYTPIDSFFVRLIREGVHGCCLMMTREVANAAREIPDGFVYHDFFYNLTAASLGDIKTIYQPLMYYRLHDSNACGLYAEKSYQRAMSDYAKNLKNMELILDLAQFKMHRDEIYFYISYYKRFLNQEKSSLSFLCEANSKLGMKKMLGLLVNNYFGKSGVKFMYQLLNLIVKH